MFVLLLLLLLLLLLSRFSRVRLCATPETAAHQAPPSLGFSRQEQWSGLPFPSPMHESEKWKWSRPVVSDSSDPMDCSLAGSSVRGIFQARVLEWGAIAFSSLYCYIIVINITFYCLHSESESRSVMSTSLWPHGRYSPQNSPGQNIGVASYSLLQGIFPTQGLNPDLLNCRWILCHLSHQGS